MINIFYEHILDGCRQRGIRHDEGLHLARSMGYEGLDCDLARLTDKKSMKAVFDSTELHVDSIYAFYDLLREEHDRIREKAQIHLDTAAYFGCSRIMIVPGFFEKGDDRSALTEKMYAEMNIITELAGSMGITVIIEDFDDDRSPICDLEGMTEMLRNVSDLYIAFDTGNFAYVCEDELKALEVLLPHIRHVHLKDRALNGTGEPKADISGRLMYPCAVGDGYIRIDKVMERLAETGYGGSFSAEHFGAEDQFSAMERSYRYIRQRMKG